MQDISALVLEISKQPDALKMSIFEQRELVSTLRHVSQCPVNFSEINKLSQELISILNKADKGGNLEPGLIKDLKQMGQLLWDHLLTKSAKDRLKSAQVLDLILSLDEELINIPWELLYDGSSFLCLNFNLGRVIRAKGEVAQPQYRSFSEVLKMLVLANPTADLKSAYLEGLNIKNQLDRKRKEVRVDFKSTSIDKLYVKKNLRDYDLVHFAGHCEYDSGEPKNSGWVFCDGKLTAADIFNLSQAASFPTLIFSNACYSAKQDTDLVDRDYQQKSYSLASAFLFAGVRHYIGTIRRIEDPVSLSFAKEFYSQLISGKSVGESLRQGRLSLIKEYGITSIPWAIYLLYGDPNFRFFKTKVKPMPRMKRFILAAKNWALRISIVMVIVSIAIYLYMWLPTVNPSSYVSFLKAQRLFQQGQNQEVILRGQQIAGKDPQFLAVYPLLADTYRRLGNREAALKYYFDYALYSEKKQDKSNLALAYLKIGWFYHLEAEFDKAMNFYQQALNLSRQNLDKLNEADALGKMAVWYIDKKDFELALELLTKSSEINRGRQNIYQHRYNLACDYFNLGLLFINKDDFVTAREFYDKSFRIFNKLKLTHELSDYYFNVGEIYSFQKEYQRALDSYFKGLNIDRAQGNLPNLASGYNMIGELYLEMDNLAEAEKYFNLSREISLNINCQIELASTYYNLGLLYKKRGRINKARENLRLAQEIYSSKDLSRYQEIKKELLSLDNR